MARDYPALGVSAMESLFTVTDISELIGESFESTRTCDPGDDAAASLRTNDLLHNYLPNDLLRKVDTASMACGLEVRCPFLDRDLAATVLNMPIDQLIPGGQRKGLLRAIARKYLPREVVDRPKMGFAIPIGEWFRNDHGSMRTLLEDHLRSAEPFGPIHLERRAVLRFLDEHLSGRRDHGQRLFTLLTLSIWARNR
jgi:asparagine synthase (glutamine-hydrolysing)